MAAHAHARSTRDMYSGVVDATHAGGASSTRQLYGSIVAGSGGGGGQEASQYSNPLLKELDARWHAIEVRVRCAELAAKQRAVLQRLDALEGGQARQGDASCSATTPAAAVPVSATQARLQGELDRLGASSARFCRVPEDYYDQELEYRRGCLDAASVEHLTKSIVMVRAVTAASVWWARADLGALVRLCCALRAATVGFESDLVPITASLLTRGTWVVTIQVNTKASEADCQLEGYRRYLLVVVQYAHKLDPEKLKRWTHSLWDGKIPKKRFNWRLCSPEDNDRLTGFQHNAVSPVGTAEKLKIVVAKRITELTPDFFWMGGGETDLKLGMTVADFCKLGDVEVVDINV